jgi:DNA-binding transcriptional LysR family regulator
MILGDGAALVDAASAGLGIIQVPTYLASNAVKSGAIVEILDAFRPPSMPISLVYPTRRNVPSRVRVLAERLTAASKSQSK